MKNFTEWLAENMSVYVGNKHPEDDPSHVFYKSTINSEDDPEHVFFGDFDKFKKIDPNKSTIKNKKLPINFSNQTTVIHPVKGG